MKKLIIALTVVALTSITIGPLTATDAKPAAESKATPARTLPFSGKLASVDKLANTGKVGGAYCEGEHKKLNTVILCLGSKPEAAPKKDVPAK